MMLVRRLIRRKSREMKEESRQRNDVESDHSLFGDSGINCDVESDS